MKKAVILFNLGGPDKLESVEPFLFNLFNDPEILSVPSIFRYPLAKFISKRRAPIAKNIYREIGNKSPILELTQEQAKSLEKNSILLALTAGEEVYYGGDSIGVQGVRPLVRRLLRIREMPVILQVDQDADGDALVRVIKEARLAGGAVSVATRGDR